MKDFAKSIRTMNSNKEEIIKKKKEAGATLKVDNGQKLEFSDGTTYVKTSFSDDYREAHNYTGNSKIGNEATGPNCDKKAGNAFDFETKSVVDRKEALKRAEDELRKAESDRNRHRGELYWEELYTTAKRDVERAKENLERAKRQKVGNSSVESQEWSMFKGFAKDADKEIWNAMNKKVKNSSVREYKDSQGRIAQIDFNSDGTDADMAIYEDERMLKSVEQRNFSTIRDAEQYVQSHGFRRVG